MKHQIVPSLLIVSALTLAVSITLAAQDRFTLKTPNGIAFSEFKGYESWQVVAPSQPDDAGGCGSSPAPGCIKAVLGNPVLIKAYNDGIPANGKPVPDGAMFAKVEWRKSTNKSSPYVVTEPGPLSEVSFMIKDSKRFKDTKGWGFATFLFDPGLQHVEAVRKQRGVREHVPGMPCQRDEPRLRVHQLCKTVSAWTTTAGAFSLRSR